MSADLLREAASAMRRDGIDGQADDDAVVEAVADWLEYVAQTWRIRPVAARGAVHGGDQEQALAVATAYLGT